MAKRFRRGDTALAVGGELGPCRKHLTEQQVTDFGDGSAALLYRPVIRTFHNSSDPARAVGL